MLWTNPCAIVPRNISTLSYSTYWYVLMDYSLNRLPIQGGSFKPWIFLQYDDHVIIDLWIIYVCTLCNWYVLYAIGMFSMQLVCSLFNWYVLYAIGMLSMQLVCTLCNWYVFYAIGIYSMQLVCTLCNWYVLYAIGIYYMQLVSIYSI